MGFHVVGLEVNHARGCRSLRRFGWLQSCSVGLPAPDSGQRADVEDARVNRRTTVWTAASLPSRAGRRVKGRVGRRSARPVVAALLSLVPGGNSWLAGRRFLACAVALATMGSLVLAVLVVQRAGGLLHTIVSPSTLISLVVLNLVVLGLRLGELRILRRGRGNHILQQPVELPHRRRQRRELRRTKAVAAMVAASVVALPHIAITWQLETVRRTVVETFEVPTASAETVVLSVAISSGDRTDDAGHTAAPSTAPSDERQAPGLAATTDGTIDILLVGLDAGAGRTGARNDANMVLSIDPRTADVALIGIPRNLVQVPLPSSEDDCRCYRQPLYSLYEHGHANAELYPEAADPGAAAIREAASALLGRQIEWYFVADLAAFRHLVDAVGGIEVEVSEAVEGSWADPEDLDERVAVDIEPGHHHLDGSSALAYVRVRADSDDYRRMARQRCLVASASGTAQTISPVEAVGLLASARGELASDIPRTALPDLVDLVHRVETDRIDSIGLVPPDFVSGRVDGYPVPDVVTIREVVKDLPTGGAASRSATSEC